MGNPGNHPQAFQEFVYIKTPSGANRARISLTVRTRLNKAAVNLTLIPDRVAIYSVSNHLGIRVEKKGKDRATRIHKDYMDWVVSLTSFEYKEADLVVTVESGILKIPDISKIKKYVIDGEEYIKIVLTGNSYFRDYSILPAYLTRVSWTHGLSGKITFL